jgi:4-amino-4-deoxy-L-arabinose transferase-like glycosyltransferase
MTPISLNLDRLEEACGRVLDRLAARPRLAAAALLGLALVCYLPGLIALPPVDRTEVVYAEMTRAMVERGDLIDARFLEERYPFRPIGITWLQMVPAKLFGKAAQAAILTYRLPSLVGAILAVLSLWGLLRPLIGDRGALIAAGFFAVTPIVALQAELAIPEGPLLLAIVLAQTSLLRLYCAADLRRGGTAGLAVLFWAAQGFGILINALAVPILSASTLVALYVFDRDLKWLKRLRPLYGLPLMLIIAAPWLMVRAHLDGGVPFSTLTVSELIRALGGAQDMKWKAAPLTFTLALLLGFLPGALLWVPALRTLWAQRASALHRFLLAWIAGYLVYLELISSKPALYTVQAMFPAAAAAAALALQGLAWENDGKLALPDYMLRLPAWLVAPGMAALFVGALYIAGAPAGFGIIVGALLVTALFTLSARAARRKLAAAWVVTSVTGFALFLGLTFGVLLPYMERGWPAARIAEAIRPFEHCVVGPVGVVGFREPSGIFLLGRNSEVTPATVADWIVGGEDAIAVVEDRRHGEVVRALEARRAMVPTPVGCVSAFNVMRGCPLKFSIYVTGASRLDPECRIAPRFVCKGAPPLAAASDSRCR